MATSSLSVLDVSSPQTDPHVFQLNIGDPEAYTHNESCLDIKIREDGPRNASWLYQDVAR